MSLFPRGLHPVLFWSLLVVAAALTVAGLRARDPKGFFMNLSAEAWGTFATVVLIDSVLRRQREKEQAPMVRLAKAEAIALDHACRDLQEVIAQATPEQMHSVDLHLRHIIRTVDDIAAQFARYLPDAELAIMLRLRHAAQLALAHSGENIHRVVQHLARVGVEASRLHAQLTGNSLASSATATPMADEGEDKGEDKGEDI